MILDIYGIFLACPELLLRALTQKQLMILPAGGTVCMTTYGVIFIILYICRSSQESSLDHCDAGRSCLFPGSWSLESGLHGHALYALHDFAVYPLSYTEELGLHRESGVHGCVRYCILVYIHHYIIFVFFMHKYFRCMCLIKKTRKHMAVGVNS